MAIRAVEIVSDDTSTQNVTSVTRGSTVMNESLEPLETTLVKAGIVLPVVGQNIVQNAVVSTVAPANPYEGQVWIDIS